MATTPGTLEHKKELQKRSNILVVAALVLVFASRPIFNQSMALGIVLSVVGTILWFWGLGEYSKSKGYSPVMAALGLLSCIGLLILIVIPNKYMIAPQADPNSNYPRA